jgi:uncharacterized protein YkwD
VTWPRRTLIATLAFLAAALLAWIGAQAGTAAEATTSRAACPGQGNGGAPAAAQERAMLCLVNRARSARGLVPLAAADSLTRAADRKSGDILRCGEFSHEACGREFTFWISHFGYQGCSEGENIAWGSGSLGTPRSIFRAWMYSQGHRENILGPYEDTGIGLRTGRLEGYGGAHVWTQEFGSRQC